MLFWHFVYLFDDLGGFGAWGTREFGKFPMKAQMGEGVGGVMSNIW